MLTVDLFSVYLMSRVDTVIRYIEVYFTFGLPDYVRYIEEFAISRFVISRFCSIHFTVILAGAYIFVRYIEDFVKWRFVKSRFHCIYHIRSGIKSNFICNNIPTKTILFFFGCSEVNSTWLITSEQANQRAQKVLFTCVVYTNSH